MGNETYIPRAQTRIIDVIYSKARVCTFERPRCLCITRYTIWRTILSAYRDLDDFSGSATGRIHTRWPVLCACPWTRPQQGPDRCTCFPYRPCVLHSRPLFFLVSLESYLFAHFHWNKRASHIEQRVANNYSFQNGSVTYWRNRETLFTGNICDVFFNYFTVANNFSESREVVENTTFQCFRYSMFQFQLSYYYTSKIFNEVYVHSTL